VEIDGEIWKYSCYDQCIPTPYDGLITNQNILDVIDCKRDVKPEFEMYNVTCDPYEETNLCFPANETARSKELRPQLQALLDEQRQLKCLKPVTNQGAERAGGEGDVTAVEVTDGPAPRPAFAQV
jgi:hypothetical protein